MSLSSLEACRAYACEEMVSSLSVYDVVKYQCKIVSKINDLCLEMGFLCKNDKGRFDSLRAELTRRVYEITKDYDEQGKIFNYASRIMRVTRNYGMLTNSSDE